jgi:hypothetical protein
MDWFAERARNGWKEVEKFSRLLARCSSLNAGDRAVVQFSGFRCMAIFDGEGKWRDEQGRELPQALAIDFLVAHLSSEPQQRPHR